MFFYLLVNIIGDKREFENCIVILHFAIFTQTWQEMKQQVTAWNRLTADNRWSETIPITTSFKGYNESLMYLNVHITNLNPHKLWYLSGTEKSCI